MIHVYKFPIAHMCPYEAITKFKDEDLEFDISDSFRLLSVQWGAGGAGMINLHVCHGGFVEDKTKRCQIRVFREHVTVVGEDLGPEWIFLGTVSSPVGETFHIFYKIWDKPKELI